MAQPIHMNGPYRSDDNELLQTILTDYRQATATLDQVAITFRNRESQLRKLMAPPEPSSVRLSPGPAPFTKSPGRTPSIAFYCLGKFRVEVDGTPVEILGRRKALKILKFLVQAQGRLCPRELLLETFWPESEPEAASNRLRVALHAARRFFATIANVGEVIVYQNGSYGLNSSLDLWIDADEVEELWDQGVRFERDGRRTEAAQRYEAAELRYRGDYLEEDLYEEWTLLRRERLRDTYLHLLGRLAAWCMEDRDYGSCIVRCHKLLAEDPYREDAYRLLMHCYVEMGQVATSLHWYEICADNLRKGLDAAPSLQTTDLQRQIMTGKV